MSDAANPTWQAFFDAHAPHYEGNEFTKWTKTEVSFVLELAQLEIGSRILDLGCGTGRHAIELSSRGFEVTGVDISVGMIEVAKQNASQAGVDVEWVVQDGKTFRSDRPFDLVICLCEGGLGLANSDEDPVRHDLDMLRTAFDNLKPGGLFVSTQLNGYMTIRQMTDEAVQAGAFDPATMLSQYQDTWKLPEGVRVIRIRERLFIPPEMVAMMRYVGFEVLHVWGGTAGEWGKRPLKLDEIEAMYVCRRPG